MFLKKLVNGDINLKRAFWLYGNIYPFFISLIIIITLLTFQENIKESIIQQKFMNIGMFQKLMILLQGIIFFIYTSVATIGVWRSANNYNGKKIWVYLAKAGIVYAFYSYIQNALYLYSSQ
jgi:hypothetical protein